jgi:3-oxoacyl-[acyl-carrier-protein] synthase-3
MEAPASRPAPRAHLRDITVALPDRVVTNDDLLTMIPESQRALMVRHTGVQRRYVAKAEETALDLGEKACRSLFAKHPDLVARVDTLIFCTQSPDYLLPPNACVLHGRLGLDDTVAAFDLPHACSAYIYAISLVQALIASGAKNHVLVITADTYSKYIHPQDRSTRLLFGDGAAATWFGADDSDGGVTDVVCGTDGRYFDKFWVPAGGCREPLNDTLRQCETRDSSGNVRSRADIHMAGRDMFSFVSSRIPAHVRAVLARNGLTVDTIDRFVFHQASGVILDSLTQLLDADPLKVIRHLDNVGNTVSASIPMALRAALDDGRICAGQRVLLCGFGAGLSWGTALLTW